MPLSLHSPEAGTSDSTNQKRRTPLPVGQISILLFLRFCESASTFVIFPFLNELVASVTGGDSAKVGYYAGLMESIRQLLSLVSVMYWSRLSDQIGRKPILLLGTLALAVSTSSFGLSETFWALVISRCIFTALNSNAGVIKSMVGEMTDHSNSADAFALLHVPWAAGSSFGALVGGTFARPHDHFSLFQSDFWLIHPYLLPCAVMTSIALFACWLIVSYLNETVKTGTSYKNDRSKLDASTEPLLIRNHTDNEPVPFRDLLHLKVLIPIICYVSLASLHASSNAIQPLFLAMPVDIGGLGLPPREVGYILGLYGITNTIFQTVMLGKLVRRFGVKTVFMTAISAFIPVFAFSPLLNILVRARGVSYPLWILLACQLSCSLMMELGYGCVYIFITDAAPNKRSLGATNGLAQTLVSIGRIVTPVMASSLLSFSIQNNILWGYAVYVMLMALTGCALGLASYLPRRLD